MEPGGLESIKILVLNKHYDYGEKVEDYLAGGYFTLEDIESSILNGSVYKTKKDKFKNSIGNKVYYIIGKDTHGYDFYTQGKIVKAEEGKGYFLITAHPYRKGGYHE